MKYSSGNCQWPDGCESPIENPETGLCATHGRMMRKAANAKETPKKQPLPIRQKKPIAKISKKMAKQISEYSREKRPWIKGKRCAVFPHLMAVDIHHKKGKVGYADAQARAAGITLLMDKRYWLAVSRVGHNQIENNPAWAKKMGFSLDRNEEK